MPQIEAWHFLPNDRCLQFEPHTFVLPGKTIRCEGEPKLCKHGLHASERIIDALNYAPGNILCRVVVSGDVIHGDDKIVGTERTVLWMADATEMLRQFACLQALSSAYLWDCPDIVMRYLRTGDERIRAAARSAAWAASTAARADTDAARAAMDAARSAAWAAGAAAWAASTAAWSARDAAVATASTTASTTAWAAVAADWAASTAGWAASTAVWAASIAASTAASTAAANTQLELMAWMLCGPETAAFA